MSKIKAKQIEWWDYNIVDVDLSTGDYNLSFWVIALVNTWHSTNQVICPSASWENWSVCWVKKNYDWTPNVKVDWNWTETINWDDGFEIVHEWTSVELISDWTNLHIL